MRFAGAGLPLFGPCRMTACLHIGVPEIFGEVEGQGAGEGEVLVARQHLEHIHEPELPVQRLSGARSAAAAASGGKAAAAAVAPTNTNGRRVRPDHIPGTPLHADSPHAPGAAPQAEEPSRSVAPGRPCSLPQAGHDVDTRRDEIRTPAVREAEQCRRRRVVARCVCWRGGLRAAPLCSDWWAARHSFNAHDRLPPPQTSRWAQPGAAPCAARPSTQQQ